MTHEPECFGTQNIHYSTSDCPICEIIRAAYKRGREDATRAIAEVVHDTIVSKKFVAGGLSDLPDLLTAIYYARGGEQE